MRPENFETEYYECYLYNGESYFFTWGNWELYDGFTFFYNEIIDEIKRQNKFEKDSLYAIKLLVDRNPDVPDDWYEYQFKITKVNPKKSLAEVKRIAKQVRAFDCQDCDLMADSLDELCKLLGSHKK